MRLDAEAFEAPDALATIAATRHRFSEALAWTRRSLAVAPTRVAPVGIRDALIELGRYLEGFAAVQRRLDLRPLCCSRRDGRRVRRAPRARARASRRRPG